MTLIRLHRWATRIVGLVTRFSLRIGRPKLTGAMFTQAHRLARPGDIILSYTRFAPTNPFIPGLMKHSALIAHDKTVIVEAAYPFVRRSSLVDVWTTAHRVVIVRPKFANAIQSEGAVVASYMHLNKPYDTLFGPGDEAFYCSELVLDAYEMVGVDVPRDDLVTIVAGRAVFLPDTIRTSDHFDMIFDSEVEA